MAISDRLPRTRRRRGISRRISKAALVLMAAGGFACLSSVAGLPGTARAAAQATASRAGDDAGCPLLPEEEWRWCGPVRVAPPGSLRLPGQGRCLPSQDPRNGGGEAFPRLALDEAPPLPPPLTAGAEGEAGAAGAAGAAGTAGAADAAGAAGAADAERPVTGEADSPPAQRDEPAAAPAPIAVAVLPAAAGPMYTAGSAGRHPPDGQSGGWGVQAFASASRTRAEAIAARIEKATGRQASAEPSGGIWKVRCRGLASRDEAQRACQELVRLGYEGSFLLASGDR